MRIVSSGLSDVGRKRSGNEDAFICDDSLGLYVVADGMGGHAAGEVASGTAVQVIERRIRQHLQAHSNEASLTEETNHSNPNHLEVFRQSVQEANNIIVEMSVDNPSYTGMGTTVTGLFVIERVGFVVHVGDSRLYRLRGDQMQMITQDHSWVYEQAATAVDHSRGSSEPPLAQRNYPALGNKPEVQVDTEILHLEPNDCVLLCSDGLTGMLEDEQIVTILQENRDDLNTACRKLIDEANANGGTDNITAVVLSIEKTVELAIKKGGEYIPMRRLALLLAILGIFGLNACTLYRQDKMWISDTKYQNAKRIFNRNSSLVLTKEELHDLHWQRAEVNEAIYRLSKEYHLETEAPVNGDSLATSEK